MGANKWQEQNTSVTFSEIVLYYKLELPVKKNVIQFFIIYSIWVLNGPKI